MVLSFSIGNFRSINEIQTLDFRATGLISENREVDNNNIVELLDNRVLKVAGVYGPNGSGKSNLVKAMEFFTNMVGSSLEYEGLLRILVSPFKLSTGISDNYGYFQMNLLIDSKKYRYGFSVAKDANSIDEEWLFGPAEKNETYYFKRKRDQIDWNKDWYSEANNLPLKKVRKDALFLTFVSSYNGEISQNIRSFIADRILLEKKTLSLREASRFNLAEDNNLTNRLLVSGNKTSVLEWLANAGLFYEDIQIEDAGSPSGSYYTVSLFKRAFNRNGEVTSLMPMSLEYDESLGTQKLYSYIGTLNKLFSEGGMFVVDEIDGNFHPALLLKLISFFNNPEYNKANAQLLFTSHDTNLLDPDVLRRDQIYFTEKSQQEASVLYSLADLKGIRNNADFARQYLAGLYGALPVLDGYLTEKI